MFRRLFFGTSRLTHEYHHHQTTTIHLPITNHNPNIFTAIPPLRYSLSHNSYYSPLWHHSTQSPYSPDAATKAVEVEESQDMYPSYKQAHALWNHVTGQVTAKSLTNMSKQIDSGWSRTRADRSLQLRGLEAQGSPSWASRPPKYFSSDFDWAKLLGVFWENSEWNWLEHIPILFDHFHMIKSSF